MEYKVNSQVESENNDLSDPDEIFKRGGLVEADTAFESGAPIEDTIEEKPSMLEAGVRGIAQGASFGFADEAEAGLRSLIEDRPYSEIVSDIRSKYKAAEEEHPMTSLAGDIAGGIVSGGALSALAKVRTVASALKGISSVGSKAAKVTGLAAKASKYPLTSKVVGSAGKLAAEGVVPGVLYGMGTAEEGDTIKGGVEGAVMGGVTGGVLGGVGEVGKQAAKAAADIPFIGEAVKAFKYGKEGQGLVSQQSISGIEKNVSKQAKKIASKADETTSALADLKGLTLQLADKDPATHIIDRDSIADTIEGLAQRIKFSDDISTQEKTRLLSLADDVRNMADAKLKPSDANAIRQQLQSFTPMGSKTMSSKQGKEIALNLVDELANYRQGIPESYVDEAIKLLKKDKNIKEDIIPALKNIMKEKQGMPAMEKIDDSLSTLQTFKDEYGISKLSTRRGEAPEYDVEKLTGLIGKISRESESGSKARRHLERVPKLLERAYGAESAPVMNEIQRAGELFELSRKARGQDQSGHLGGFLGLGRIATIGGGNVLGQSYGVAEKILKFPAPALKGLSNKLLADKSESSKVLANKLEELANLTDEGKKKALMNTLMQSPFYRQQFNKLLQEEE
jgi:hypothetical protein